MKNYVQHVVVVGVDETMTSETVKVAVTETATATVTGNPSSVGSMPLYS